MARSEVSLSAMTMGQLVLLTGSSHRTVRKRLHEIEPVRREKRAIYYDPRKALPLIFQPAEQGADELSRERAKLARVQAEAQDLKNAETRGHLLQHEDVVARWQELILRCKDRLRALPSKLRRRVRKLNQGDERAMLAIVDEALSELARDVFTGA